MNNQTEEQMKPTRLLIGPVLIIGIAGGLLWSTFSVILYLFNFAEVAPNTYLLNPWVQAEWTEQWQGHLLSIMLSGIISLIPSILYYFSLKRINSMWIGVFYGILLWFIVIFLLPLFLQVTQPITEMAIETIITTLSVFILYGTFIGYSIAYDYYDLRVKTSEGKLGELKSKL